MTDQYNDLKSKNNSSESLLMRHYSEPNFTKETFKISPQYHEKLLVKLCDLYPESEARKWITELEKIPKFHYAYKSERMIEIELKYNLLDRFTEKDMILITYGDMIKSNNQTPLKALDSFLKDLNLKHYFNAIHILPFFPYSSDRGFSITDFRVVNLKLGSWDDIEEIGETYQLMFDGVFNHISSHGEIFQKMLSGNSDYQDFAIVYKSPDDLTVEQRRQILRPRTSDVLTQYQSLQGPIWVWTTFSKDQIDLNYRNPKVLMQVIETLLLYVRHGADLIRLDAATYLWKEPGTSCAHLPETHTLVKLFRDVLNLVAPTVALITETNVPHQDNISYFGDGKDEAQVVYNFALPPLVLHTFYSEDTTSLVNWAQTLATPSNLTTFFNILDTHDGIGLLGVKNILSEQEIQEIVQTARKHGAFISYKAGQDGNQEPYEINTTWFSALNLDNHHEDVGLQVKRFVASRSIALVLRGIPGIYLHGLLGTRNDIDTVRKTKSKRDINRKALHVGDLVRDLKDPKSRLAEISRQLGRLLETRIAQKAFHPMGDQQIIDLDSRIFCLLRTSPTEDQHILTLTNVTHQGVTLRVDLSQVGVTDIHWYDLVAGRGWIAQQKILELHLKPYDVLWLMPFNELEQDIEA